MVKDADVLVLIQAMIQPFSAKFKPNVNFPGQTIVFGHTTD